MCYEKKYLHEFIYSKICLKTENDTTFGWSFDCPSRALHGVPPPGYTV